MTTDSFWGYLDFTSCLFDSCLMKSQDGANHNHHLIFPSATALSYSTFLVHKEKTFEINRFEVVGNMI